MSMPGPATAASSEIHALGNPYYNIEGLGIRFVASPRHADLLLVTGPVSKHMAIALKRTYDATPEPKIVVAVGACGCTGGIFGESYASLGRVANVLPVDVEIPGMPTLAGGVARRDPGGHQRAGDARPGRRASMKGRCVHAAATRHPG